MKPSQRIFIGVIATIDPHIETAEEVRDRVPEAAKYIPIEQLGMTDDCGYSPFCDGVSTTRDKAFAKIKGEFEMTFGIESGRTERRVCRKNGAPKWS